MPKKDSTIRTIELIKEKGISPKEIHQETGIKYNTITNALGNNDRNFTIDQIVDICEAFDFNQTYCVFGKGDKFGYKSSDKIITKDSLNFDDAKEISNEIFEKEKTISYLQYQLEILKKASKNEGAFPIMEGGVMMVPLVTEYAHAGYLAGYGDAVYLESLPKIPWIVDHEYKGKYVCFEVRGDSMDDGLKHSYEQGDILLCREISPIYWKCKLHYNKWNAFVVVHKTLGIVVKQIIDQDVENGIITCHSFNPIYEDFKVDLQEVVQLFNVVKHQSNG